MKKVVSIKSLRHLKNLGSHSWDIVFEWEDTFSSILNLPISNYSTFTYVLKRICEKFGINKMLNLCLRPKNIQLEFVTHMKLNSCSEMRSNVIPIIIDFWYNKKELELFKNFYRNVSIVFVTNKEVYTLLNKDICPFPVEYLPLSLPDKYALIPEYCNSKKYDFCFMGRIDPYFLNLIKIYSERHPDFEYVYSKGISVNREYYTSKGKIIGKDTGRESYIKMLRMTKVTCYSTPGFDQGKGITNEYNQVTPRVLEMLANGCQVIGHYPNTDDVNWYNLSSVVPNVENYEQFESVLNTMLTTEFDYNKVSYFLKDHYTSKRVPILREILEKYDFKLVGF